MNESMHNILEYSVSEIAGAIKRTMEEMFGYVRVRGEISGWKGPHSSGHAYFRLKDQGAALDAVCWRGSLNKLGCILEEGLEIIAVGRITTYPGKSNYQIVIERAEPAGAGALMALLEKRKKMLEAEGLFSPERKQRLPFMPRVIGVVTSPTGAVIRDILHRIADRFPAHVIVWPVAVQGMGAAEQIANAIRGFNGVREMGYGVREENTSYLIPHTPYPDVIIIARGGGSLEDLWPFNEEIVVRAVAESTIPVISAVGHETDTTLVDFAADMRAPTPTAAAEMAVPVLADLRLHVGTSGQRLQAAITHHLARTQEHLRAMARGLIHPRHLLEHAMQRLDDWEGRLHQSFPALLQKKQQKLSLYAAKVQPHSITQNLMRMHDRLDHVAVQVHRACFQRMERLQQKLSLAASLMEALNYTSALKRGYVLVQDMQGKVLGTAGQTRKGEEVTLTWADGAHIAVIK